ncbi:MAG: hypothetical protein PHD55_10635, partial [Methanoregula sp.]|nr:hypothetical protein [Methanoregula sp.]
MYVPQKGETPTHRSGDPTGANRPISNPTESMATYPIYKIAKGLADTYKTNVTDRYAGFVEPRLQGRGAWETVGQAGVGLVSSPGLALEFLGMIPAGTERLAREGARDISTVPMHAAGGLVMQAEGISKGIKDNPGRTVGELVGMGLVTHGAGKAAGASPIRPGIGRAVFPTESYTSLGIQTSRGGVVGFRPLIGLGKTAEGVHLTGGTPRIRIEAALGSERFTPATPLETRIVQGALGGEEAARISLARNIRTVTQSSGLSLRQASPIVQEVVKQHGIPNPQAVSKVITTALRDDGAQLYGSVIQRGIGQEAGKVGLSRVPRDFDIQVKSTTNFQKRIVTDINRAAGREVVAPEGKAGVLVKKTGEKLFDLHDMETAAAERQFTPKASSEYIAFGIKGENLVKTREGINTITLSEQATRKLEGSMQLRPTIESTHVDGSNLILSGRLLPKKPGRIKDIADYYFAEKLAIDVMKTSRNPVRVGRAIMAERNLDSFLGTWGSEVAGSVKVQYSRALTEGTLSVKLADYSTPPATATGSRFVPHAAASPNLYPSPAAATPSQSLSMTSPSMRAASEFARGSPSTMKYSPPRSPSPPTYNPSPSPSIS